MRPLFDSNILIGYLNDPQANRLDSFLQSKEVLPISRITWIEVLAGAREQAVRVRSFLDHFTIYEVAPEVAEAAIRVRQTSRLKLSDALIYATALVAGRVLVTLNSRDFAPGTPSVLIPL